MAKSPTAMIHELEVAVAVLKQQVFDLIESVKTLHAAIKDAATPEDVSRLEATLGRVEAQLAAMTERVARLEERTEQLRKDADPTALAVLKADLAEHKERFKTKEAWFRGLVASALVAMLTSGVALIVALVRK